MTSLISCVQIGIWKGKIRQMEWFLRGDRVLYIALMKMSVWPYDFRMNLQDHENIWFIEEMGWIDKKR